MRDRSQLRHCAAIARFTASADNLVELYAGGSVGEACVKSQDFNDDNPACCMPLRFDESHAGWTLFAGVRTLR